MEEIINKSEDSGFSDGNSQSYDIDKSSENINRPTPFKNKEHNCSDIEHKESSIWMKAGPHFPFIRKLGLSKFRRKSTRVCKILITPEITDQA